MAKGNLKSNIWKLYLIKGLKSFMLAIPIIVLFYQQNGLTMREIFTLQALFSMAIIALEIPSGYFSDLFGRRNSMTIGGCLVSAGFFVYSQSNGFGGFLLAEIILGMGYSFMSGTDSALLYDSLLNEGRASEYSKREGKSMGIGTLSESIASVLGGLLGLISLRLPLYCDAIISLVIIPVALSLREPSRKKWVSCGPKEELRKIAKLVKFSLHQHKEVKWIILYSALVSTSTLVMFWLMQPYLLAIDIPLSFFGVVLSSLMLVATFCSWNAHVFEKKLGKKITFLMLVGLPSIGYFLLGSLWVTWSVVFIGLFYVTRGVSNPVTLNYVNGLIDSEFRATILSVKNLVGRLIFSVAGPVIGWVSDAYSLKVALFSSGSTFLLLGLMSLFFLAKAKAKNQQP